MSDNSKRYVIGVDTGGTFTDVTLIDEAGQLFINKAPTTPHDFSKGVMDALAEVAKDVGISRRELLQRATMFKHGTTVATNAVINGAGSKVGFVTTKGFEDTTLIGRAVQRIDGLSDEDVAKMTYITKPDPLVPKSRLKGVFERVDFRGNVAIPLNVKDAREQIRCLVEDEKVDALGVSLLFSWINPIHEQRIRDLIQEMYPKHDLFLTFAHELVPLIREYGRANTVILNCFVGKTIEMYLGGLQEKLREEGFQGRFLVMQSSGGTISGERVPPMRTLHSGPVGGVIGSQYLSGLLGHKNVVSTDMGGTSFDVSLIRDGMWGYEREPIISRWRVMLPLVKVDSIGAGGGTIARVDVAQHRLLVGPESAGASPGPVCYDAGGTEPTVCDADLILGFLNPDYFLGGRMKLNKAKAEQALQQKIAAPLRMNLVEAAGGIFTIVNAHMADLIRVIAMRVGLAPEEFTLYAFGGTGPMHAAYYAGELGIKKVCVFPTSSVFSAFGIVGADIIQSVSFSLGHPMPANPKLLDSKIAEFQGTLGAEMAKEGFQSNDLEFRHTFNMRYRRQVNYHAIPLPAREYKTDKDVSDLLDSWVQDFERVYGRGVAYTKAGIELVSMDIDAIGKVMKPVLKRYPEAGPDPSAGLKGHRLVFFPEITDDFVDTAIYQYEQLQPNNIVQGPAVIESTTSTIVVPPGKRAKVETLREVVLEL